MSKNNVLFHLIKSMSRNEKVFFKKYYASGEAGESKNYFRLFDAIDSMKEYDEKKLLNKFKEEKFVRQLPVAKNYLQQQVLHALRIYELNSSAENRIFTLLSESDIFLIRELYEEAEKKINTAYELAVEYEKDFCLPLIFERRYKLILFTTRNISDEEHQQLLTDYREMLDSLSRREKLRQDYYLLKNIFLSEQEDEKKKRSIRRIADNYKYNVGAEEKLIPAIVTSNIQDLSLFYLDKTKSYQTGNSELLLKKFNNRPHLKSEEAFSYLQVLQFLISENIDSGRQNQSDKLLKEMYEMKKMAPVYQKRIMRRYMVLQLHYFIAFRLWKSALVFLSEREEEINHVLNDSDVNTAFLIRSNIAIIYFSSGNNDQTIKEFNQILSMKNVVFKEEMLLIEVIALLPYYEKRDFDILEYRIPALKRKLKRYKNPSRFEWVIVNGLERMVKDPTRELQLKQMNEMLEHWKAREKEADFVYVTKNFDFLNWIKKQITVIKRT